MAQPAPGGAFANRSRVSSRALPPKEYWLAPPAVWRCEFNQFRLENWRTLLSVDVEPTGRRRTGLISLGVGLDHSGDSEAALQAHGRAVELSPSHSGGLAGLHHWSFGRLDEAARLWAPALARSPTNTNTYWSAGKTYLCLGMLSRARELLGKSVAFEPSFAWAQHTLTLVFLREGNRGPSQ